MKQFIKKLFGGIFKALYSEVEHDVSEGMICPICESTNIKYIRITGVSMHPRHGFKCSKCGFIILEDDFGHGLSIVLYNWNRTYELVNSFNKDNAVLYDVYNSRC